MLPKTLKYGSKVESAIARSQPRLNISPTNGLGPYGPSDTILINIPTNPNTVLCTSESVVKFTVSVTNNDAAGNAFRWDSCGAQSIFSRCRVFHGSNLLEDIDSYGMLAKMLYDLQLPTDNVYGKQTLLSGCRADLVGVQRAAAADKITVASINSGERIGAESGDGLTAAGATVSATYCLNLISILGSLSSQNYFPLFACTSAPLRLELTLASSTINAMSVLVNAAPAAFSVTNFEYIGNFIELGDSAMQIIYSSLDGQPLQYVVPSFRNFPYSTQLADTTTNITMPIPAKYSSLKSITLATRQHTGATLGFWPLSSVKRNLREYQFRIGSQIMPPKPPTTTVEFFTEVLKAWGSVSDINYQPSIDKLSYSQETAVASNDSTTGTSNTNSGSFYVSIDLESYSASDKSTIFSGLNTNTSEIFWQAIYNAQAAAINIRWDAFANFDAVLVFENNSCYVKF